MLIQTINQNEIVVEVSEHTASNKKNPVRILHVDDDPSIREISKLMLMDLEISFDIDNACCVDEAFKKLSTGHYDIVISDYEMPLKNGLEFLKELRDQKNDVAFIIFTGRGREDVAVKALNLGADSYLNKNGSPETVYCELADAINKTVERKKSRELLAKSESKYHALVENSLQGIAILQIAPIRIAFTNGAFGKTLGYSSDELTSFSPQEIMSLVYHEDRAVFFKRMENRLRGEPAESCFEFRAVRKDGSIIWLSSLANRVEYDGQPAVQGMFLDINESKKAAAILSESEQRYRELANCLPDIVFEIDLNGHVEFANERAAEISGYSLSELEKGVNIFQFIAPEDREQATKNIQRLLAGGNYKPAEYQFVRKDGTTFPALITATPRVCKNKVTGFRGIVLDISERKKAEEGVKKSEKRYRELANFLPEIVFETDLSGKITFLSQTAFEITGYTPDEVEKGMNMFQFVVPKDCERAKENIRRRIAGEKTDNSEYTLFRKNGETYPAIVKTAPIFSENRLIGLRGLVIDITERKKAEDAIQEKDNQFRKLAAQTPGMLYQFLRRPNGSYCVPFSSNGICTIFGCTPQDVKDDFSPIAKAILPEDSDTVVRSIEDSAAKMSVWRCEYRVQLPGQEIRWMWGQSTPERLEDGSILWSGFNTDITEQKKIKMELQQSEERYRSLFEQAPLPVAITTLDGTLLDSNFAMQKLSGYSLEELKENPIEYLYQNPKDRKTMLEIFMKDGFVSDFPTRLKRKDKNSTEVVLNVSEFKIGEKRLLRTTIQDVNELVRAEEKLDEMMGQLVLVNEKLGVVGSLTRHDVCNKLSAITGYSYLLKKKHADHVDIVEGLSKIEQSVKDSMKIFDFAKMYEQLGAEELTDIDVETIIGEAVALFSGTLPKIMNECHGLTVLADSFLRQMFYNFIDNTRKYGQKTTIIKVTYKKTDQGNLVLTYDDDGVGISAENKLKLFSEGFSTGGSTGFGLFLTKKMIDIYGWNITEEGEQGKGAKFIITIPKLNKDGKENYQIVS